MTAAAESAEPQAATRVLRTITVVLGFGGGVFFALTVAQMVAEADYVATAWQIVASLLMFAVPLVLAIACHLLPFAAIQRALGVYALGFILVVATWLPAMTRHPMPLDLSPWPLGATMLGVVSAALAFPPALAWAAIALNVGLVGLVRYQASGGANLEIALQDTIFTVAFALAFVALAMVAVRGGHAQDAAAGLARAGAARAAYTAARAREEVRLDALVHDEIMTALYYASQDRPELAASIRAQAARALAELSEMMDGRSAQLGLQEDAREYGHLAVNQVVEPGFQRIRLRLAEEQFRRRRRLDVNDHRSPRSSSRVS